MKRIKRDDTEHGFEYYWADEVDALLAQQKRPQNCGTGHCSCIECVMEPAQPTGACAMCGALQDDQIIKQPSPPPECKTEAEKTAFAFGWWKALETQREQRPVKTYCGGKAWPVAPKIGCVNHDCDKCNEGQPAQQCWKCGDMDSAFHAKCDVPACGMKEQS